MNNITVYSVVFYAVVSLTSILSIYFLYVLIKDWSSKNLQSFLGVIIIPILLAIASALSSYVLSQDKPTCPNKETARTNENIPISCLWR